MNSNEELVSRVKDSLYKFQEPEKKTGQPYIEEEQGIWYTMNEENELSEVRIDKARESNIVAPITEKEAMAKLREGIPKLSNAVNRLFGTNVEMKVTVDGLRDLQISGEIKIPKMPPLLSGIMKKAVIRTNVSAISLISKQPDRINLYILDEDGKDVVSNKTIGWTRYNLKTDSWLIKKKRF